MSGGVVRDSNSSELPSRDFWILICYFANLSHFQIFLLSEMDFGTPFAAPNGEVGGIFLRNGRILRPLVLELTSLYRFATYSGFYVIFCCRNTDRSIFIVSG